MNINKMTKTLIRLVFCVLFGISISASCVPTDILDNITDIIDTDDGEDTDSGEESDDEEGKDDGEESDDSDEKDPETAASDAIKAKFPYFDGTDYMAIYDHMPAGIYEYSSDDDVLLIAKSSDGGGFYIRDVDEERADPTFTELGIPANYYATDGRTKGYFFDRSLHNYDNDLRIFRDTARYAVIDEFVSREAMFGLEDVLIDHSPRALDIAIIYAYYPLLPNCSMYFQNMLVSETGREKVAGHDCTVYTVNMDLGTGYKIKIHDLYVLDNGVCAQKVDYDASTGEPTVDFVLTYADTEVGDFNDVFTEIHMRHCTGSIVLPENMLPQYTKYADEWLHSWYSIPAMAVYDGKGTIRRMSVIRTYDWKPYDNVCTIEVVIEGATYNETAEYIEMAEDAAKVNVWSDENIMEPDLGYIIYNSWFDPCHPDCVHDLGDTALGFMYRITYMNGLLTIIFDVIHTEHL